MEDIGKAVLTDHKRITAAGEIFSPTTPSGVSGVAFGAPTSCAQLREPRGEARLREREISCRQGTLVVDKVITSIDDRPQIAAHGPAPNNGIVMNGIDVLEHDGFREVRGSDASSPRAVGVITNHTGFDVEGRRTIDILAKA
jgi:hypothetical protein